MARTKKNKLDPGKKSSNPRKLRPKQQPVTEAAKSKPKRQSKQGTESIKCFLLDKIPAELRNSIWREVLVADRPIFADPDEPHQPALLRTCKQLRDEATTMFFQENDFILPMYGYDTLPGLKWCNVAKPYLKGDWSRVDWHVQKSGATWTKFLDWLRLAREGKLPRYKSDGEMDEWLGFDEHEEMFDLLDELEGMPWEKVVPELEQLRNELEVASELEFGLFDDPGSDC